MRLYKHVAVSTVISVALYASTNSLPLGISSFLSGFLLDLDHIIDYWREHPRKPDLIHFFRICEEFSLVRVYLFFHSLELIIPLALVVFYTRSAWVAGILIGFCQHMLFDQIFNPMFPFSYFFVYRWNKRFANENVFNIERQANG